MGRACVGCWLTNAQAQQGFSPGAQLVVLAALCVRGVALEYNCDVAACGTQEARLDPDTGKPQEGRRSSGGATLMRTGRRVRLLL